jgi:hypothetical protein
MSDRTTQRSRADASRLRAIHDAAVALGAVCSPGCRFHASRRGELSKASAGHPLHRGRRAGTPGSIGAEIGAAGMTAPPGAAPLRKVDPDWADEPRRPAGERGGGEWARNGDQSEDAPGEGVLPAATRTDDTRAKKQRFVDAHLADTRKAAEKLGVPVENILGLAAFESGWGEQRFAAQGNNYFGIHYPAPLASGFMLTADGDAKVATFASYADSLQSFVAISGSIVQDERDPEAFAVAAQNSGKFGIKPKTGTKDPAYVGEVAKTIRGLRPIVAGRGT